MVALAEACAAAQIPGEIALVVSDVEDAGILSHARARNLPNVFIAPGPQRTRLAAEAEALYVNALREAQVDLVALAGFLRVLKQPLLEAFAQRIVNIHPSLLPAFPGLAAWKQALDYGVKYTGCTVHFVEPGVDTGPIIGQQVVPVMPGDTPEVLHERIQKAERVLYPAVVAALARGQILLQGRQSLWRGGATM